MSESTPAHLAAVGALYDSVSPNTGDRAIGIAVSQELARHGIRRTEILSPFSDADTESRLCIVGGGELLRPLGDRFYDRFRPRGPAVLNSVGVWPDADHLDYLREYRRVTARSSREVDILRSSVPDAELLPCTTTTLRSEDFAIPGLPDDGEPVVGIQVVPHTLDLVPELVEAVNSIDARKVIIPFTHYNNDDTFMGALPFDRTRTITLPRLEPLQLHAVIRRMSFVVVSSLHATIFAYSQNVPFVTSHQEKIVNYLSDRGLSDDFVFSDLATLEDAVRRVQENPPDFREAVEKDVAAVRASFADLARLAGVEGAREVTPELIGDAQQTRESIELLAAQREEVVVGRDATIARLMRQLTAARAENHSLHVRLGRTQQRVLVAEQRTAEVSARLGTRVDARVRAAFSRGSGLLSRVAARRDGSTDVSMPTDRRPPMGGPGEGQL